MVACGVQILHIEVNNSLRLVAAWPYISTLCWNNSSSLSLPLPHSLPMFTVLRRFTLILVAVGQIALLE